MPSAQVIDLNPRIIPREETNLEKTLGGFVQRNRENQVEARETDALKEIYGKYQQDGRNLEDAIIEIQTRPGISPTTRVNSVNQLLQFQKHNQSLLKQNEKEQKVAAHQKMKEDERLRKEEDEIANRERAREALKQSKATPEQIALFEVSPVGGQTKIVEDVIENASRQRPSPISPDVEDFDQGLTPKERVKRQDARFSLQTPIVKANSDAINSLQTESLSLDLLSELTDTDKVGEGVSKLNINPKTGDLIIPQLASPEEQLFVKTVNDFTVKAKDSFGARVTNFELDRFMQRLPTLANSPEGRKLIISQMKKINEINAIEKKAIQEVFDTYGVRNIDYVEAENIARKKIAPQKEALRKEYLDLERLAKKEDQVLNEVLRSRTKEGYTAIRKPDGTIAQVPTKNVPNLEEKGYKRL